MDRGFMGWVDGFGRMGFRRQGKALTDVRTCAPGTRSPPGPPGAFGLRLLSQNGARLVMGEVRGGQDLVRVRCVSPS